MEWSREKVFALLHILNICYSMLVSRKNQSLYTLLDVCLVSAIVRSEWHSKKVGCVTIKLDIGG